MGIGVCCKPNHEIKEKSKHLEGLLAANEKRPVRIVVKRYIPGAKKMLGEKILLFCRHGQGYHNAAAAASEYECDCAVKGGKCPYLDDKLVDPHLTEVGKQQMIPLSKLTAAMPVQAELVLVSPLCRAVQTALFGFQHLLETKVPFVAFESAREISGQHKCDKRRPLSEIKKEFPQVDFSNIKDNEDSLWTEERESYGHLLDRAYEFMVTIGRRPEKVIAIASHSTWLLAVFNCILSIDEADSDLKLWFKTGELRAVTVAWIEESI